MVWDGSGWLPPRSNEPDETAYPLDDVHEYIELGRRIANAAMFVALVVAGCALLYIGWRLGNGH